MQLDSVTDDQQEAVVAGAWRVEDKVMADYEEAKKKAMTPWKSRSSYSVEQ